jgi:hypothetical protein
VAPVPAVFLNKGKNGTVLDEFLPERIDGSQLIVNFTSYIATCLQIKSGDLEFLCHCCLMEISPFPISVTCSLLRGLIKRLRLKAEDFAILAELSGIDFSASPQETLEVYKEGRRFCQITA